MKSDKYEPRVCEICGKIYKPGRKDQRTCASKECVIERKRLWANETLNQETYRARKREYMRQRRTPEPHKPKEDTIIAIGYADRQMAASLAKAGKVRTEL